MWFVIGLITAHYLSYFAVGIAQQALYQRPQIGDLDGFEPFTYTFFLTTSASLTNFLFSLLALCTAHGFSKRRVHAVVVRSLRSNPVLRQDYLWVSLTFMAGKVTGNHALTLVDYATQALAKCAKPVSVVILGVLHFGLRFKSSDVVCSVWIVASLVVFNIFAQASFSKQNAVSTIQGNLLLLLSLICDGLTGARLDRLVSRIQDTVLPHFTPAVSSQHAVSQRSTASPSICPSPATSVACFNSGRLIGAASAALSSFSRQPTCNALPSMHSDGPTGDTAFLTPPVNPSDDPQEADADDQSCSPKKRHSLSDKTFESGCSRFDDSDSGEKDVRTDESTCASYEMMCTINILTCFFSFVLSLLVEGAGGIRYIYRNPNSLKSLTVFCVVGALGQLCSFKCISRLGSLQTSTITATRKVVMVVVSVLWFNTPLHSMQWTAVASVGLAVAWRTSLSYTVKTRQAIRRQLKTMLRRLPRVRHSCLPITVGHIEGISDGAVPPFIDNLDSRSLPWPQTHLQQPHCLKVPLSFSSSSTAFPTETSTPPSKPDKPAEKGVPSTVLGGFLGNSSGPLTPPHPTGIASPRLSLVVPASALLVASPSSFGDVALKDAVHSTCALLCRDNSPHSTAAAVGAPIRGRPVTTFALSIGCGNTDTTASSIPDTDDSGSRAHSGL
eukprot:GHVS01088944.1.p1 GENE.GHVS01088944.1~~GHVS01088944.1.p1  ORF type:complete len:670 (-),score=48.73 GHVS01088944.1:11-2020(-)